ncbi:RelA/SpoT domain-containing protein [Cupriavidus gilardii]|uniref:RelA/SpoT domain-containing protein n=1 Tax=Cupriavidus gilardii TaxID=82541 RepID=UPI000AD047B6|nr:RelA/SpoT domain-containing protein [Cupriavidus gilardii]
MAVHDGDLQAFLRLNNLAGEVWAASACEWPDLQEIARDYTSRLDAFRDAADYLARMVQKFEGVHSVRWRVKDPDHLLAKIVRKRASKNEKYDDIDVTNYTSKVTDLVGLRALHLFKDDCFAIHEKILSSWSPLEDPVAYVRKGDDDRLLQQLHGHGLAVKEHSDGYRSVHYLVGFQPSKESITAEIQVRTIFEEGWSEIDHRIRYPNFSDNELLAYILTIFNRLAGSADEMAGFVRNLAAAIALQEKTVADAAAEREAAFASLEAAMANLGEERAQGESLRQSLDHLRGELDAYKAKTSRLESAVRRSNDVVKRVSEVDPSLLKVLAESQMEDVRKRLVPPNKLLEVIKQYGINPPYRPSLEGDDN